MKEERQELKEQIEALKSELEASMYREDLLLDPDRNSSFLKRLVKKTMLGKAISNPNSKVGKVLRSPRSMLRIMLHPSIVRDIKNRRNTENIIDALAPVKFFVSESCEKRVNLLVPKIEAHLLKTAVKVANEECLELRIITSEESANPLKYREFVNKKIIPEAKRISFYSSVDQQLKNDCFELEVNEDDIFITSIWRRNEEKNK